MTIQQLTLLMMPIVGVALFFAGRSFVKKLSSEEPSFIPASILRFPGIVSYLSILVSWAGVLLALVCLFLLFS
jgi:hypothetical protein